jgi:hypothetical protein
MFLVVVPCIVHTIWDEVPRTQYILVWGHAIPTCCTCDVELMSQISPKMSVLHATRLANHFGTLGR